MDGATVIIVSYHLIILALLFRHKEIIDAEIAVIERTNLWAAFLRKQMFLPHFQ
jgi:hypothetical protein